MAPGLIGSHLKLIENSAASVPLIVRKSGRASAEGAGAALADEAVVLVAAVFGCAWKGQRYWNKRSGIIDGDTAVRAAGAVGWAGDGGRRRAGRREARTGAGLDGVCRFRAGVAPLRVGVAAPQAVG